jgi:hypothetical protein
LCLHRLKLLEGLEKTPLHVSLFISASSFQPLLDPGEGVISNSVVPRLQREKQRACARERARVREKGSSFVEWFDEWLGVFAI